MAPAANLFGEPHVRLLAHNLPFFLFNTWKKSLIVCQELRAQGETSAEFRLNRKGKDRDGGT
jgi:hypothetical protein